MMICVDASFVVKLLIEEDDSDKCKDLWESWVNQDASLIAPYHLAYETLSVIRQRVHRGDLRVSAGEALISSFHSLEIQLVHPEGMLERAWLFAQRFSRPTLYDAYYLAVGALSNCEVWTADRRLHLAVNGSLPWVKLLRDYRPSTATL